MQWPTSRRGHQAVLRSSVGARTRGSRESFLSKGDHILVFKAAQCRKNARRRWHSAGIDSEFVTNRVEIISMTVNLPAGLPVNAVARTVHLMDDWRQFLESGRSCSGLAIPPGGAFMWLARQSHLLCT